MIVSRPQRGAENSFKIYFKYIFSVITVSECSSHAKRELKVSAQANREPTLPVPLGEVLRAAINQLLIKRLLGQTEKAERTQQSWRSRDLQQVSDLRFEARQGCLVDSVLGY